MTSSTTEALGARPEGAGGGWAQGAMAVTANPLATQAALDVLASGGNAADAAIAAQLVLGLVEPQSSGLGGGAFVVYYDAEKNVITTLDAREKAPQAATERYFYASNTATSPLSFTNAVRSGKSVGVPGVPRLLEKMSQEHGRRPWPSLFPHAIKLASEGFQISPRMAESIAGSVGVFSRDATASAYFLDANGVPKTAGTLLQNPEYAATLDALARSGADAFYYGAIASDIVKTVQTDPGVGGPGAMTESDLAGYTVVRRPSVCGKYRGNAVCGMGPPSSGAVAVTQMLGILEHFDMRAAGPNTAKSVHLFTQAGRLAFADRNQYLADSDYVRVPVGGLIDPAYIASRAALVDPEKDMGTAPFGTPADVTTWQNPDPSPPVQTGTSHISIRDRWGNALSMTTTVESAFGNGRMTHGFLLNNQLTDFSFVPSTTVGGVTKPVANRVEGGKRPRSSMSPTIIFDQNGKVSYVTGSPGGSAIIHTTTQSIVAMIDWQLSPQEAVTLPHFLNSNGTTTLETWNPGVIGPNDVTQLLPILRDQYKHPVAIGGITSGLSVIKVTPDGLVGGADPRREGTVGAIGAR